ADELRAYFAAVARLRGMLGSLRPPGAGVPEPEPELASFGDYEVLQKIASGGMGVVYKARQKSLPRLVALKVIRDRRLADADEVRRFRTEAEHVANLDHPNIVQVYEVGEHEGQPYFSMMYVEGGSLAQHLAPSPPRAMGWLARLMVKVARAVHYAHQRG